MKHARKALPVTAQVLLSAPHHTPDKTEKQQC